MKDRETSTLCQSPAKIAGFQRVHDEIRMSNMLVQDLIKELAFSDSPCFLRKGTREFATAPHIGHLLRTAAKPESHRGPSCALKGVYVLRESPDDPESRHIPVVYLCAAKSESDADQVHRLVWNQDAVPFLIVHTPKGLKFYSGFEYSQNGSGVLSNLLAFNKANELIRRFHRDEIDSGRIWQRWNERIRPERRLNCKLLDNLRRLDGFLQGKGLVKKTSHALIGKYVYLRYLRDRNILSDRVLAGWGIDEAQVFGRNASFEAFREVVKHLENWLNGNIFPMPTTGPDAPGQAEIRYVAGVFSGDDVLPSGERQLSLDFQAYDFSFIPIETLSIVYEQFLHQEQAGGMTKGREQGAYYTPIPVVNFMISEMEERLPLNEGVTVFDPACGSGAFLVQAYRRLIEKAYPQHLHSSVHPIELRKLLVNHIFGLDRDSDACSVTELSLILTMLDYVNPPDLQNDKRVKLPELRNKNIFHADFFEERPQALRGKTFDWVIGNPPWKKLNSRKLHETDRPAWNWMQANKEEKSVGGYQLARAFAWEVENCVADGGEVGLFLPAMTLFDQQAKSFRQSFFRRMKVATIANFSNLAEVLAGGRFRVPAASFFFSIRGDEEPDGDEHIRIYSPLVANQEAARSSGAGERRESWCIVINDAEITDVPFRQIINGSGLPWKMAAWGSHFDRRLLRRLGDRFSTLEALQDTGKLVISEGPPLRNALIADGEDKTEFREELLGSNELDVKSLARLRHVFVFPQHALRLCERHYLRLRGGRRTLCVCHPPHVIVSAARNFAIYSDEFVVVPSRQIGIISESNDRDFLKALSLLLSSDFAFYHQFFTSTEFGVKRDRATLTALLEMPVPLAGFTGKQLKPWIKLHDQLVKITPRKIGETASESPNLFTNELNDGLGELLNQLNEMVFESLQLDERERALVNDLVHVRLELNDGKLGEPAVGQPTTQIMRKYALRLKKELDSFLDVGMRQRHKVDVVYDRQSAMMQIDVVDTPEAARTVTIVDADRPTARELAATRQNLRHEAGQWVYFDRSLKLYNGTRIFLFKPMQRFHWTESQAMVDAAELIAETLSAAGDVV